MAINTQAVPYHDEATRLTGMFIWDDEGHDRRPGILVVHGGGGLDDHAQGRARRFAELGFIVFACAMYADGVAGDRERVMAHMRELRGDLTKLCKRAEAGIDQLAAHPRVDGRLAAVGYCFGGTTVLELARHGSDLAGVVSVHGGLQTTRLAQPGAIKASILALHGALDPHVPLSHAIAFMEEMDQAGADWQLIAYGGAVHGFTHDTPNAIKSPGVAYDARTDVRSSIAIRSFFAELFPSHSRV